MTVQTYSKEYVEELIAEVKRQKHINSVHLQEHQRLFAVVEAAGQRQPSFDRGCNCSTCVPAEKLHNALAALDQTK